MYNIMIVDDERIIAEGLAEMLAESELPFGEIATAGSAFEALELLGRRAFDFILTDIRMPRMDGLELFDKVKAAKADCKVIFLSGYSDFEYARTALKLGAIDYLLKPVDDDEVLACLRKAIGQLEDERSRVSSQARLEKDLSGSLPYAQGEFFRNLLHCAPVLSSEALELKFRELHIPLRAETPVTVFVMSPDDLERALSFMDEALLQFALQNMVSELLGERWLAHCFAAGGGVVVFSVQENRGGIPSAQVGPDEVFAVLHARLGEVQAIVARAFKFVCSFALLNEWMQWRDWPDACSRLIAGVKLRTGQGQIFAPLQQAVPDLHGVTPDRVQQVMEAINLKDAAAFAAGLDRLLERIEPTGTGGVVSGDVTAVFLSISSRIVQVAQQERVADAISQADMEKMSNLSMHNNLTQLRNFLVRVLQEIVQAVGLQQRNPTEQLVEQVKSYIASHLYENLSLDQLADKAHVNPSYLSRIFRQYTREQLTSYVTRMKVERAAKLLTDGDMRVQDIAMRLGFDNPNYFAKVFRKATGLSPNEYRQSHSGMR